MKAIWFIVGLMVGGAFGFIVCALLSGTDEDDYIFNECNMFDDEEVHENCTVQVLHRADGGEPSIGWFENNKPPVHLRRDEHED